MTPGAREWRQQRKGMGVTEYLLAKKIQTSKKVDQLQSCTTIMYIFLRHNKPRTHSYPIAFCFFSSSPSAAFSSLKDYFFGIVINTTPYNKQPST